MATQTITRPKKSVPLSNLEMDQFKKFLKGKTWFEASMEAKISREVLSRVLAYGSGSEKTINRIKEII